MNQNEALRRARLVLGFDVQVGRVADPERERRFCVASKSHNLSLRAGSFTELIEALETYGIPKLPKERPTLKALEDTHG